MKSLVKFLTEKKAINYDTYLTNNYDCEIKNAIHNYVSGMVSGVNNELRDNKNISKKVIKLLDEAFKSKYATKKKIDVYRVVDWSYMKNVYGIYKNKLDSYINNVLESKNYMSTTIKKESVWGTFLDEDLQLHITSDNPIECLDINSIFNKEEIDCADQEEILLPRNLKLKFKKYTVSKSGIYLLEMEII